MSAPADDALLKLIRDAVEQGRVSVSFNEQRYREEISSHIALYEQADYPVLVGVALLGAAAPLFLFLMVFAPFLLSKAGFLGAIFNQIKLDRYAARLIIHVMFMVGSMLVAALMARFRKRAYLTNLAIWTRLWKRGVLTLENVEAPSTPCGAPGGDWRAFALELERAPAHKAA